MTFGPTGLTRLSPSVVGALRPRCDATFTIELEKVNGTYYDASSARPYNPTNLTLAGPSGSRKPLFGNYYNVTSRTDSGSQPLHVRFLAI